MPIAERYAAAGDGLEQMEFAEEEDDGQQHAVVEHCCTWCTKPEASASAVAVCSAYVVLASSVAKVREDGMILGRVFRLFGRQKLPIYAELLSTVAPSEIGLTVSNAAEFVWQQRGRRVSAFCALQLLGTEASTVAE